MKRLIKRKLNMPPVGGVDPLVSGLLGVGLVSATGGYILTRSKTADPTVPENIEAEVQAPVLPPLLDLIPADRLPFTPPAPLTDGQDAVENVSPTRPLATDAVPQLAWQVEDDMPSQGGASDLEPSAMLPARPFAGQPAFADEAVPPALPSGNTSEQGEEEMDDDELNGQPSEGETQDETQGGSNLPALDDVLSNGGQNDFTLGGGFQAPTPQEISDWESLFGAVTVPQSRYLFLDPITLYREESTGEKLADIYFDDPVLDAAGVTMQSHPAFEIRNGNELWLRDGLDLTDPFYVPQTYLEFYALADPSSYASTVIYIMDAPLPGDEDNPQDYNQYDDGQYNDGQDVNPNGNPIPNTETQNINSPNGQQNPEQGEQGNGNPSGNQQPVYEETPINEQDEFGDMTYQYHQDPDII